MIDPASIRTASFSLTPTGYNPEEVDRFLAELADATPGSIDLAELRNASFSLTPTGYNPEEVDQFLGSIADQLADAPASPPEPFQREQQPVVGHEDEHRYEPVAEVEDEPVAEQHHEAEVEHEADDVYQPVAEIETGEEPATEREPVPAVQDGWHQPQASHEPEAEPELVQVESIPDEPAGEPPVASLPEAIVADRAHADLGGLSAAVQAAIESLDGLVKNELHNLREASALEIDDILAERQRLVEDATSVGRRHIDEASAHAEKIVNKARKEGDRMRQQVEQELREERDRFQQSLADRDAQAQARATEILEQAEARRHEADELVASAAQAQAAMLASFEQARSSLIEAAERNRISSTQVQAVSSDEDADEHDTSAAA
jgi:DivIVA domain-containing protein